MIANFESENVEYLVHRSKRRIAFATLDIFDRRHSDLCHFGKVLLRKTQLLTPLLHDFFKLHSLLYCTYRAKVGIIPQPAK